MLHSVLAALLSTAPTHAAPPEDSASFGAADRVIVFVLDGIRATDLLDAPKGGTPVLEPIYERGVLMTGLQNLGPTATEPSHRTMLTGQYQPHTNFPWYETRFLQRSFSPTVWEAIYAATGRSGAITGNTVFMDSLASSVYPGHPGRWQADELSDPEWTEESDEFIFDMIPSDLAEGYALYVVNVHEADKKGHFDRWDDYLSNTDEAVDLIEEWIETGMEEGDAVILLADHGRHTHDYTDHGDECSGCRDSWIVAFGAGIRSDRPDFVGLHEITDVAPTLAWLLGAEMPTSRGRLIRGILDDPPRLPMTSQARVDPAIAMTEDGVLHRVADQDPARWGLRTGPLVYQRSEDGGATWSTTYFGDEPRYWAQREPRVVAAGSNLVRSWKALDTSTQVWDVLAQISTDGGETWGDLDVVADGVLHCQEPEVALDSEGGLRFFGSSQYQGRSERATDWWSISGSVDRGFEGMEISAASTSGAREIHTPTAFESTYDQDDDWWQIFVGVMEEDYVEANQNREVLLARQTDSGINFVQLTDDGLVNYHPTVTRDADGTLWAVWVTLDDSVSGDEVWRLESTSSDDAGETWSETEVVELEGEPWRPRLLTGSGGTYLAWIEIDGTDHAVKVASFDGGSLGSPLTLGESANPLESLAADVGPDGQLLLTWHESFGTNEHVLVGAVVEADLSGVTDF